MEDKVMQGTDIDVLIKFQPMPKRFMVWDVLHREWVAPYGHEEKNAPYAYDMYELMCRLSLTKIGVKSGQYVICQSTNLFDKDGKEIFEGSIVQDFDDAVGVVYYDTNEGAYLMKSLNGDDTEIANSNEDMQLLGHILSNPELLEEK